MCLAAGDIPNETWQRYVGLAPIAILDVSVGSKSSLWKHTVDGEDRDG